MKPSLPLVRRSIASLLGLFIAFVFVQQGWMKFDPASMWTAAFEGWGYPVWFRILIGVVEVVGGVCLILPWLTTYSAAVLSVIMAGAWVTLARSGHLADVLWPTVYVVVLIWVGFEWRGWRLGSGRRPAAVQGVA